MLFDQITDTIFLSLLFCCVNLNGSLACILPDARSLNEISDSIVYANAGRSEDDESTGLTDNDIPKMETCAWRLFGLVQLAFTTVEGDMDGRSAVKKNEDDTKWLSELKCSHLSDVSERTQNTNQATWRLTTLMIAD